MDGRRKLVLPDLRPDHALQVREAQTVVTRSGQSTPAANDVEEYLRIEIFYWLLLCISTISSTSEGIPALGNRCCSSSGDGVWVLIPELGADMFERLRRCWRPSLCQQGACGGADSSTVLAVSGRFGEYLCLGARLRDLTPTGCCSVGEGEELWEKTEMSLLT